MKIEFQGQKITVYFAQNLAYLLKKNHFTYKDLLKELEYDYSYVYLIGKWVNDLQFPTLEEIIKIAIIFQVSLEELITINLKVKDSIKH